MNFQGANALVLTLDVWTALTYYLIPLASGIVLGFWFWLLRKDVWAIVAGILSVLVILLFWNFDPVLVST